MSLEFAGYEQILSVSFKPSPNVRGNFFARVFLYEVSCPFNDQGWRDVAENPSYLRLQFAQHRVGVTPRKQYRQFELPKALDGDPIFVSSGMIGTDRHQTRKSQRTRLIVA